MYILSKEKRIIALNDIPQSNVGAPRPEIIASEHSLILKFIIQNGTPDNNKCATIQFNKPYAHSFGPPNDETFNGHPLYKIGLKPYTSVEVLESGWIDALESMNSIHPYHKKEIFMRNKRHFILSFHDSTFECIASDYRVY